MVKESGQLLRVPPHGGRDREGKSFTLDLVNARRPTQLWRGPEKTSQNIYHISKTGKHTKTDGKRVKKQSGS